MNKLDKLTQRKEIDMESVKKNKVKAIFEDNPGLRSEIKRKIKAARKGSVLAKTAYGIPNEEVYKLIEEIEKESR